MFQVQGPTPTHGHGTLVLVASSNPPLPLWSGVVVLLSPSPLWCGVAVSCWFGFQLLQIES